VRRYIERQSEQGELTEWIITINGLQLAKRNLNTIDLGVAGGHKVNCITRTRLRSRPNSLGVITSPGDEEVGLTGDQLAQARLYREREHLKRGPSCRKVRSKLNGVLLIYPISRFSGHGEELHLKRQPIFEDPRNGSDIMGIAISFPFSETAAVIQGSYIVGTVGWRAL
jgi:hypothetical protein